jgi:hypothetical protein
MDHRAAHAADLMFEDGTAIPANDSGDATHKNL